MSVITVKAAVIAAMQEISNIGLVEGRDGRTEALPWEDATVDYPLPLWVVKLTGSEHIKQSLGQKLDQHTFTIRGYFPHSFEADSEAVFDGYIAAIKEKFKADPALDVCAKTLPPRLLENDFVMYGAQTGQALCHFARIELQCQEWISA